MPRNTAVFAPTFKGVGVVRSDDILKDGRYGHNEPHRGMPKGHLPVRSYLAVPVVSRSGEVIGGLFLGHGEPGRFIAEHEELLTGIAGQAATAIDNARLFQAAEREVAERRRAEAALQTLNNTLEQRVIDEVYARSKVEDQLRQIQKMEAVGQLTGGIAHDFNNLLTPIMGGLELIAGRVEEPRLKRLAETALESARRGAKLTSQLLAFSRIQRISMNAVAVNGVIETMQTLLHHTIGRAVTIETRLDPEAGHALCDANQLENAILNLAINGRDAMPEGGLLTIATRRLDLAAGPDHEAGEFVRVTVTDTGHGMAPEVIARATEPFYSTKPLGKGTGLGLAQVYGIARQSGGTLQIESALGRGTSVHLLLPATAPPEGRGDGERGEAVPEAGPRRRARIMVIDDDGDVRAFLADSLQGLGHLVLALESGEEGLARLEEWPADLVLVDYAMPGMHGAEVARTARQRYPRLPIVFVTGYAESEQIERAVGPDVPVLRKPFTIAELAAAVEGNLAPERDRGGARPDA
ncbi:MAG: response regulator [Alphaproteobacteria bacterium]|nr:response regulator [Alphaproteobacteria bacterium]